MRTQRIVSVIDTHTQGTPERIVTGGVPPIPGDTMAEKLAHVRRELDDLRSLVVNEPRGHRNMCASFLTKPITKSADFGVLFLEPGGYANMCGHGVIAICTALVETGMVSVQEPTTEIRLDTVAGLVTARVRVQDGEALSVKLENVTSFVLAADVPVRVKGFGDLRLDVAYGGNFYAILPADLVGLSIEPRNADNLILAGIQVWKAVNEQLQAVHPTNPAIRGISYVQFSGPAKSPEAHAMNVVTSPPWNMDRSPCGTGTSARMAILHSKGELNTGEVFVHESILGGLFRGTILREEDVGRYKGIATAIEGSATITGFGQFLLDPRDPFPRGFVLGRSERPYGAV